MLNVKPEQPKTKPVESSVWLKKPVSLDIKELRKLCVDCGADDVGFVAIDRSELDGDREDIKLAFPRTRTLIGFVSRMVPDNIRTPMRSVANVEFHHTGDRVEHIARDILKRLAEKGVRGVYPSMWFPMEMDRYPGKNLGGVAQTRSRSGGAWKDGDSP